MVGDEREELELGILPPKFKIALRIRRVFDDLEYIGGRIWYRVSNCYSYVSSPIRDHIQRRRLSKVFGIGDEIFVYPGPDHPFYAGPHPDNMDCMNSLNTALTAGTLQVSMRRATTPGSQPLYILGGPTSTRIVQNIMGSFKEGRLFVPGNEPPIDYMWYFTSPGWPDTGFMVKHYVGRQLKEDWGHRLVSSQGMPLTDKIRTDSSGLQTEDWLLIMRLPNLISEAAYGECKELLIIAGAQGPGTKAFATLIGERPNEVKRLIDAVGDNRYYQALFHIGSVYHNHKKQQSLAEPDSITFQFAESLKPDKERIEYWFRHRGKLQW